VIKELRESKALTQEALAYKCKLSLSTVRRVENENYTGVTLNTAVNLAAVLGPEVYDVLMARKGGAA
jgi:DNA-binding XRE family transcriptional regulator